MDGKFKKGHVPHNKDKKIEDYLSPEAILKVKSSQFVKGECSGENNLSWKGGVQKISNDCVHIWVGTNSRKRRPVLNYEAVHGKIPYRWIIYHLDQDKDNDEVSNLIAIPRAVLMALNKGRIINSHAEITAAVQNYINKNQTYDN
jgi:hypothetical protein